MGTKRVTSCHYRTWSENDRQTILTLHFGTFPVGFSDEEEGREEGGGWSGVGIRKHMESMQLR